MEKANNSGRSVFHCGMYSRPFLRHSRLVLPGLAPVPGAQHSAHDSVPFDAVATTHNDCFPGFGLSESKCAVHIRTLARVLSLMHRKSYESRC